MICLIILGIILQASFIVVEHKEKYTAAVILKGLASLCFVILGFLCASGDAVFCLSLKILKQLAATN